MVPFREVRLGAYTFGRSEHRAVFRTLASKSVTQGKRVREFEIAFLNHIEAPNGLAAAMVNSGSSANLLAAAMLRLKAETAGDRRREVITPALTWATTVAPLIQHNFKPIFVDVGPDWTMDASETARYLGEHGDDVIAIMPVHLIGNAANVSALHSLCQSSDPARRLTLIEDACEALGVKWEGKHVGTWGDFASFSFYQSHHASTIEGGMVLYPERAHEILALREHGWIRQYPESEKARLAAAHPDLNPTWTFDQLGYNVRSTELNAAIGIEQLGRQRQWRASRLRIAKWYDRRLRHPTLEPRFVPEKCSPNPFSYPVMIREGAPYSRREIMEYLADAGVETRPVMTGNITRHPWYVRNPDKWGIAGPLTRTDAIHSRGFLLPCRPGLKGKDLVHVAASMNAFLKNKTGVGLK